MPIASDLPHPSKSLRPAWWVGAFGVLWAVPAWFVFPPAVIPAIGGALVGFGLLWPISRVLRRRREDLAALNRQPFFHVPDAGYPTRDGEFYIGKGYHIEREHLQQIYELRGLNSDEVTISPDQVGDPRLMGVGHRETQDFFIPLKVLNHMVGVWGATGYGKTRFAENVVVQAIRDPEAPAVCYFDPKGDDQLRRRLADEATRAGRPFYWFSLARPDICDTYSPIARFQKPTDLQGRLSSLIPESKEAHWHDHPLGTAVTVAALRHYVRDLLLAYGGQADDPPLVLRAIEAQRRAVVDGAELSGSEALAVADSITLPNEFAPAAWRPDLFCLHDYGSTRPETLLAWMLRLRYPWASESPPETPNLVAQDEAAGLLAKWQELAYAPLPDQVQDLYDQAGVDQVALRQACGGLDDFFSDLQACIAESPDQRARNNNGLKTGLAALRGVRDAINAPDPSIQWERVIDEGAVVLVELNALEDEPAAQAVGKMMLSDLASYVGYAYGRGLGRRPFFGVIDEVSNVICEPLINLLNKGRGGGVHLMVMGQGVVDLTVGLGGDGDRARQVIQNLNTSIQLATRDGDQAKAVSEGIEKVRVAKTTNSINQTPSYDQSGGPGHIGGFSAGSGTTHDSVEVPVFPPESFNALPKGQALVTMEGKTYLVQAALLKETDFNFDEFWSQRLHDRAQRS